MNVKFMKVKRIVIPALTVMLILAQVGCSVNQSDLLQMIKDGQDIEIEIAVPESVEQGTESELQWIQLASLETDMEFRKAWDDILGITGSVGNKNGVFYVNTEGNQELNNTLRVVLNNRAFLKVLEDENTVNALEKAVSDNFVDIEADSDNALYMGLVRYFNLLPGTEDGYANPDKVLDRAEAMSLIMRAESKVDRNLTENLEFTNAVGESEYNLYAQQVIENSYLDLESKSLNNKSYNSSMSRAEFVYMVVSRYFSEDLTTINISKIELEDAKDGGNIADKQGFTGYDYSKDYELVYMLNNPDEGVSTELYKALAVAYEKGLVTAETRWDEAIQLDEAAEIITRAYLLEVGIEDFNSTNGIVIYETPESESVNAEELIAMDNSTDDNIDEPVEEPEQTGEQEAPAPDYIVEACNKTMYAVSSVNLRQGPSAETTKIGSLSYAQQVTVTGIVTEYKGQSCLWYQLSTGEFVSGNYLSANKPQQTTNEDKDTNNKENNDSGNSQEEKKDNPFEWDQDDELPSDGDFYGGGGASGNDSDFRF